eukprot:Amastigsp_a842161_15.p1 type:complete len:579 gc:universal Amastigsp_a842161_15:38-1774(+)
MTEPLPPPPRAHSPPRSSPRQPKYYADFFDAESNDAPSKDLRESGAGRNMPRSPSAHGETAMRQRPPPVVAPERESAHVMGPLRSPTATALQGKSTVAVRPAPATGVRARALISDSDSDVDVELGRRGRASSGSSDEFGTAGGVVLRADSVPVVEGFIGLEYAGRMWWVKIFANVLYCSGVDADPRWPRGLRWLSTLWRLLLLAHYIFAAGRMFAAMKTAHSPTIQLVGGLWFLQNSLIQATLLFAHANGWFLRSVAGLSSSSWEVHEASIEAAPVGQSSGLEQAVGSVGSNHAPVVSGHAPVSTSAAATASGNTRSATRRRHRFDQEVINRNLRFATIFVLIGIVGNTSSFLFMRFGSVPTIVSKTFEDFSSPWPGSVPFYVVILVLQLPATGLWLGTPLVAGVMIHILGFQCKRLAHKIRSQSFRPMQLAQRHKLVHERALMLTRDMRWFLVEVFGVSAILLAFILYRLVVESNDPAMIVVMLFWLFSSALTMAIIIIPAAALTTLGGHDLVILLSDTQTKTERERSELQFVTSVVLQRAMAIRVAQTFAITWPTVAKIVSLYASLLTVLYNMRGN